MFNLILLAIEKLALTIVLGGGIVMAAAVRPVLQKKLKHVSNMSVLYNVEGISIQAWNRYNRYSFMAVILVAIVELVRLISGYSTQYWYIGVALFIIVLFIGKLLIDKKLTNNLNSEGASAVGSNKQSRGHHQVELLSKFILVFALVLMVIPN